MEIFGVNSAELLAMVFVSGVIAFLLIKFPKIVMSVFGMVMGVISIIILFAVEFFGMDKTELMMPFFIFASMICLTLSIYFCIDAVRKRRKLYEE